MTRALLFDVYGTLLDVHSAIADRGAALGAEAGTISRTWRQKQLEYTWTLSLRGEYRPFRALTEAALDYALAHHRVASSALRATLLEAYEHLRPFPEVRASLTRLRAGGLKLAALSNGDPDLLERGLNSACIRDQLDAVLSVAPVKVYKPAPQVYELGRIWAGLPPSDIGFVSANAWDAAGAAAFGFRTVWINRDGQAAEYGVAQSTTVVASLEQLDLA